MRYISASCVFPQADCLQGAWLQELKLLMYLEHSVAAQLRMAPRSAKSSGGLVTQYEVQDAVVQLD
jgi:hypothetical protein